MPLSITSPALEIGLETLSRYWTIIGSVLLAASVAQPIVSSQLADIPPEDLLAPMQRYLGDQPLPPEITALFVGVFANIQYALLFAALKLAIGAATLAAALKLTPSASWPKSVLTAVASFGIVAFASIGLYFAYSSYVIGSAIGTPLGLSILMAGFGVVVAYLPIRWLLRNLRSLRAI